MNPEEFHYTSEGYNPYTLENHSTTDLCYDATNQADNWGVFALSYTLGCMSFLEYMGIVLVVLISL